MGTTRTQLIVSLFVVTPLVGIAAMPGPTGRPSDDERREKVKLAVKISPAIGFSPMRVVVTAELQGDLPLSAEPTLYCASTEWDWGDGTISESSYDCEPFQAGKSTVKRRFSAQHIYTFSGRFQVLLRLKRNDRVLLASHTSVQVRPGAREWTAGGM